MIDAFTIGITLALNNGVADGIAAIRRDLEALDRAVDTSSAGLILLRKAADNALASAAADIRRVTEMARQGTAQFMSGSADVISAAEAPGSHPAPSPPAASQTAITASPSPTIPTQIPQAAATVPQPALPNGGSSAPIVLIPTTAPAPEPSAAPTHLSLPVPAPAAPPLASDAGMAREKPPIVVPQPTAPITIAAPQPDYVAFARAIPPLRLKSPPEQGPVPTAPKPVLSNAPSPPIRPLETPRARDRIVHHPPRLPSPALMRSPAAPSPALAAPSVATLPPGSAREITEFEPEPEPPKALAWPRRINSPRPTIPPGPPPSPLPSAAPKKATRTSDPTHADIYLEGAQIGALDRPAPRSGNYSTAVQHHRLQPAAKPGLARGSDRQLNAGLLDRREERSVPTVYGSMKITSSFECPDGQSTCPR